MNYEAAFALATSVAGAGVPVFPIAILYDAEKYDGAGGLDKRPVNDHGHLGASTDPAVVRGQFNQAPGRLRGDEELGVGWVPSCAGLILFDVDQHGENDGFAKADALDIPRSFSITTAGNGEHRLVRKRELEVHIGNSSPWEDAGIDVRGDDGFGVAPGTVTSWGSWELMCDDISTALADAPLCPEDLWAALVDATKDSGNGGAGAWATYDSSQVDERTAAAVEVLCSEKYGGRFPTLVYPVEAMPDGTKRPPYVSVTRPGKQAGGSASVGYIGPGIIKMWTSAWKPHFTAGARYVLNDVGDLVDSDDDFFSAYDTSTDRDRTDTGTGTATGWETPIPLVEQRELPTFPVDALPKWHAGYVEGVAIATQTPVDLAACLVLSAYAAAAGGRVVVEARPGWREPTNLFVAVALAPGNRKSAVFQMVTRPLQAAERELYAAAADGIAEAAVEKEVAEGRATAAARAAARAKEDDDDNADELLQTAKNAAAAAEAITVPPRPRLLVDDATPEALTSVLAEQGGRAACMSAEGDIFDIIAGRYSRGLPPLGVFLKGHAGDAIRIDRKGRPAEFIEHPALTMGLAVQPAVLHTIADNPAFRGRGLLARYLFSLPLSFVGSREVGAPQVPEAVQVRYEQDVTQLVTMLAEWIDPLPLFLSAEADCTLRRYEVALEPRLDKDSGELGHIADWGSKLAGAVVRIAGLLHLAGNVGSGWREPIPVETLQAAIRIGDYFLEHAIGVFELMGADPVIADARVLLNWMHTRGLETFTRRDAHRAFESRFPKATDLDPALALLEDRGWIREQPSSTPTRQAGRRPSPTFEVHPCARQN